MNFENLRDPGWLLQVVNLFAVSRNWAFLPKTVVLAPGQEVSQTFCNCYATAVCAALGVELPPLSANEQFDWLHSNEAKLAGWMGEVPEETARKAAALGHVAVAIMQEDGHGHIGVLVPPPVGQEAFTFVTAAGIHCFERTLLANSFGQRSPGAIVFFVHQ